MNTPRVGPAPKKALPGGPGRPGGRAQRGVGEESRDGARWGGKVVEAEGA